MANQNSISGDLLSELLDEYNDQENAKAELSQLSLDGKDPQKIAESIRSLLIKHTGKAIANIVELANSAKSEQVKMAANKFIIESTTGQKPIGGEEDAFTRLLNRLNASGPVGVSPHED